MFSLQSIFWNIYVFSSLFGRELLFSDFRYRFLCRGFLLAISLQCFLVDTVSQSFYWNNLWDHSKISSGRFVAGVNETKSKIVLFQNIGYFRDICHNLFSNNACFAPDVVGFMTHILGLRIFPKSFGFFLGCSQQDLLEIICGRP